MLQKMKYYDALPQLKNSAKPSRLWHGYRRLHSAIWKISSSCLSAFVFKRVLADWIKRFLLYNEALSVVRKFRTTFLRKLLLKISDLLVNIKNQANTFSRLNMAATSSYIVEQEQIMSCCVVEVSETVVKSIAKARELRLLSSSTTSIGVVQDAKSERNLATVHLRLLLVLMVLLLSLLEKLQSILWRLAINSKSTMLQFYRRNDFKWCRHPFKSMCFQIKLKD